MTKPEDDPVGSVGDEAAKLFGALADWADDHVGDRVRDANEHLATGHGECLYCPICRTVQVMRQTSPEVRAQLATAASSFLQAAAGLLSAAGQAKPAGPRVQHIDLDDADDDDDADDAADEDLR